MAWYISATEENYGFKNCILSTEPTKVQDISKLFAMPTADVLADAKADGKVLITSDDDKILATVADDKKDKRKNKDK